MSDELTVVRSVLAEVDGPSDQAWSDARAALMAEIEAVSRSGRTAGRHRRRWMPVVGLGFVAALAVALGLLVTQAFVGGGVVRPSPAAAAVLRRAADAALASPPAHLKAGEYWYTKNEGTYLDAGLGRRGIARALVSSVSQVWVGRQHLLSRTRVVRVRPEAGSRPWQRRAIASFFRVGTRSRTSSAGSMDVPVSYRAMRQAPGSLPRLASWVLHAEAARGFTPKPRYRAQVMFTTIHDILIEPMVPARLQAGLYRVAATIPGIQMLGLRHDTLGRAGLAVGFVDHSNGYEDELLFDPTSYALLDYDETTRHPSGRLPAGTVTEETAFLGAGLVHRVGQVIRIHG